MSVSSFCKQALEASLFVRFAGGIAPAAPERGASDQEVIPFKISPAPFFPAGFARPKRPDSLCGRTCSGEAQEVRLLPGTLRRIKEHPVKKRLIALLVLAGVAVGYSPGVLGQAATQSTASPTSSSSMDQNIQLLREDIRSKKKQLIAANLNLTDAEATKFWPVYDQYTAELVKINDEKYAIIKEYADAWGNMKDDQALSLTNRALAVEEKVAQLRAKYVPIFNKVIPGTKVATFYQIERRLQAAIDLQLSSQLPLVQSQN
jgi:hypothetical protein